MTTGVIDGSKRFISHGNVADLVAVFAVTDPDPAAVKAHRHLTCFYVEKGTPGFAVDRIEHKMGIRGSPDRRAGLRRRPSCPTPTGSATWATAGTSPCARFERTRPGSPRRPSGSRRARWRSRSRYASERKQFGQPIGELQMVGAMLADMATQTEAARQLLYAACDEIEAGAPRRRPLGGDV